MLPKMIPTWVKNLPDDDPNKELLTQLAQASSKPLDAPREMNLSIKGLKDTTDAQAAADHLSEQGWECVIYKDVESDRTFWVEAGKQSYSITEDGLKHDEAFASKIAMMFGATYDGWYAKIVR